LIYHFCLITNTPNVFFSNTPYLDNNHQGISEYPIVGTSLPLHRLCLLWS